MIKNVIYRDKFYRVLSFRKFKKRTLVSNRCSISGRGRGVFVKFRLSRIQLRKYLSMGLISGWRNSSW